MSSPAEGDCSVSSTAPPKERLPGEVWVLIASNAVIALSPQRHEKTLQPTRPGDSRPIVRACLDEAEQSDAVCRAVLEQLDGLVTAVT